MQRFEPKPGRILAIAMLLLGACAQQAPVIRPSVEPVIVLRPPPLPPLLAAPPASDPELAEAYVFKFHNVERRKYCGMSGHTNGTMTIMRRTENPQCSVAGLLDREEAYHSALSP